MLKSKFVASEIAKDTTLCTQLERLNEFRTQLIAEELSAYNGNAALKAARAALDDARAAYQKAATAFVLEDRDYKQFQTEIVRIAIHNFGTTHSMPGFVSWFDNNGKDEQTSVIDSVSLLAREITRLHTAFEPAQRAARTRKNSVDDLRAIIEEQRKQLAALEAQAAALTASPAEIQENA